MENATVKNTVDGQIENVSGNCRGNGRSVGMRQLIKRKCYEQTPSEKVSPQIVGVGTNR